MDRQVIFLVFDLNRHFDEIPVSIDFKLWSTFLSTEFISKEFIQACNGVKNLKTCKRPYFVNIFGAMIL